MKSLLSLLLIIVIIPMMSVTKAQSEENGDRVYSGLENAVQQDFEFLKGKRVGFITNQTAVTKDLQSAVDVMFAAQNVNLVALFGPEHGVRGIEMAGDKIEDQVDPKTGLPVYSLYGSTRKPTPEMLEGLDALVYDIQDIGVRSYTYISTMGLAMEAASESGLEFYVLDRPNPLGGERVSGVPTKPGFESFVSAFPIPYVYGLTPGELANMLVDEKIIDVKDGFSPTIIPLKNWTRDMTFMETGLPWVPTSPHIPHPETSYYYVTTGVLGELKMISEGVGTTIPFEYVGHEDLDALELAEALRKMEIPGVLFRAAAMKPYYGRDKDKYLQGVQLVIEDFKNAPLLELQFRILEAIHQINPDFTVLDERTQRRHKMFDWVIGTDEVRKTFAKSYKYEDIEPILMEGVKEFKEKSSEYYLYE